MAKQEKWIKMLVNLSCRGQLCNDTELTVTCLLPQFVTDLLSAWWNQTGFTEEYGGGMDPYIRCHLKCLCMNFPSMFVRNADLKTISLCAFCTEAHHKSLCWDTQNGKWTSYSWRMFEFIGTVSIYTLHVSLLGAQREHQSTRLCYFILALS